MTYWIEGRTAAIRCAVCGDEAPKNFAIGTAHVTTPGTNVEFVRCDACGSLNCTSQIADFDHIQTANPLAFLRRYLECTAGPWEMFWPPAAVAGGSAMSYLDIGCGFGYTVDIWRTMFATRAVGCDPALYAIEGRRVLGDHIFHALLDEVAELKGERFDIVYSSEVIEHVAQPRDFIDLMKQRLTDKGVLVLTTPAADFVQESSDRATVTAALGAGYHAFLMSRDALEQLLKSCGLKHVIVEQHQERLIAWASMHPFERVTTEQTKQVYLDYLRLAAARAPAPDDEIAAALRAGHVYRLVKERMFRNDLAGIQDTIRLLESIQYDYARDVPRSCEGLRDAVAALHDGALPFGEVARFHLPQAAFLFGVFWQNAIADAAVAREWLELAIESTEKLCADSITNNLEAGAYFWIALSRLVSYDIAQGRMTDAGRKLVRMIASLVVPDTRIGGGAIQEQDLQYLLSGCLDSMTARGQTEALRLLAETLALVTPFGSDERIVRHVNVLGAAVRHRAAVAARAANDAASNLSYLQAVADELVSPPKWIVALLQQARTLQASLPRFNSAIAAPPGVAPAPLTGRR